MRIIRNIFILIFYYLFLLAPVSANDSICDPALKERVFDIENSVEVTNLLDQHYDKICKTSYESKSAAKSGASSTGISVNVFEVIGVDINDARRKSENNYSFESTHYCRTFKENKSLNTYKKYSKQSTKMALRVWESCIKTTEAANKIFLSYTNNLNGQGVLGSLYRKVGTSYGPAIVKGFMAPKGANVTCKVGEEEFTDNSTNEYNMVSSPVLFRCTKLANESVRIGLKTQPGGELYFNALSVEDTKLQKRIDTIEGELSTSNSKAISLENKVVVLKGDITLMKKDAKLSASYKSDEQVISLGNGEDKKNSITLSAVLSGDNIIVKFKWYDGPVSSCSINTSLKTPIIPCSGKIDTDNYYYANGIVFLDNKVGVIRFTGTLRIQDLAQININNGPILGVR